MNDDDKNKFIKFFKKKNSKIIISSLFSFNLFISLPLGIYYGIPTEPYGVPNNIEAKSKKLRVSQNLFGPNEWSELADIDFKKTDTYNDNFENFSIEQEKVTEAKYNDVARINIRFKLKQNNTLGWSESDDFKLLMHFYNLSYYPDNDGRKKIAWFSNDYFENDFKISGTKARIRELNFKKDINNEFYASFLTSNSILIKSNLLNTSKNNDINGQSSNSEIMNIENWVINFQPEIYRFSPTLKSTFVRSENQPRGNDNNRDFAKVVEDEWIYVDNGSISEVEFNEWKKEIIKKFSGKREQSNESGWYDYIWDFREPYIHSNLHMGYRKPSRYQFFNINNWITDKNKKYDISLNYQFKFLNGARSIKHWALYPNGKYEFSHINFLQRFYENDLVEYDVKFMNDKWEKLNHELNYNGFYSFGFVSTNNILNNFKNLEVREMLESDSDYIPALKEKYYHFDKNKIFMNYDSEPNWKIDDDGYGSIKFKNSFYIPKDYLVIDDNERLGEVYLIIQNDLNGNGKYTPIYDQYGNEVDITDNKSISKTTNFSSIDGETKIFTIFSGSNDNRMSPFHWGRKLGSDQIYDNYVTGWEPKNYFYDFNSFKPIELVGILLTSILIIGNSYALFYFTYKERKFKFIN